MPDATESPIVVYGSPTCHMVPSTIRMLERANAPYQYVSIAGNLQARETIRAINHGNESVPTLVFPDGSTLTEPPTAVLRGRLEDLGYTIPKLSPLETVRENLPTVLAGIALLAFGIAAQSWSLVTFGLLTLAYVILTSDLI